MLFWQLFHFCIHTADCLLWYHQFISKIFISSACIYLSINLVGLSLHLLTHRSIDQLIDQSIHNNMYRFIMTLIILILPIEKISISFDKKYHQMMKISSWTLTDFHQDDKTLMNLYGDMFTLSSKTIPWFLLGTPLEGDNANLDQILWHSPEI